jgi:hypothetical protein
MLPTRFSPKSSAFSEFRSASVPQKAEAGSSADSSPTKPGRSASAADTPRTNARSRTWSTRRRTAAANRCPRRRPRRLATGQPRTGIRARGPHRAMSPLPPTGERTRCRMSTCPERPRRAQRPGVNGRAVGGRFHGDVVTAQCRAQRGTPLLSAVWFEHGRGRCAVRRGDRVGGVGRLRRVST